MDWLGGPMAPPDWWPKVLAAKAQEVAVALDGGLGGSQEWEEDPWPWLVSLCWLEDWGLP